MIDIDSEEDYEFIVSDDGIAETPLENGNNDGTSIGEHEHTVAELKREIAALKAKIESIQSGEMARRIDEYEKRLRAEAEWKIRSRKGKNCSHDEEILWIANTLGEACVSHESCPSLRAWNYRLWILSDRDKNERIFWDRHFVKLMLRRKDESAWSEKCQVRENTLKKLGALAMSAKNNTAQLLKPESQSIDPS